MATLGAVPQNQLNALPLITASAAAQPDSVTIVGNRFTKFWGPSATAILDENFVGDPDDAAGSLLLSNYLDFSGCNVFEVVLVATVSVGALGGIAIALIPQYRATGSVGTQPRTGNIGLTMTNTIGTRTPASGALAVPFSVTIGYGWSNNQSGVQTVGTDCRLWFRKTVGATANQLFSAYVWGAQ